MLRNIYFAIILFMISLHNAEESNIFRRKPSSEYSALINVANEINNQLAGKFLNRKIYKNLDDVNKEDGISMFNHEGSVDYNSIFDHKKNDIKDAEENFQSEKINKLENEVNKLKNEKKQLEEKKKAEFNYKDSKIELSLKRKWMKNKLIKN